MLNVSDSALSRVGRCGGPAHQLHRLNLQPDSGFRRGSLGLQPSRSAVARCSANDDGKDENATPDYKSLPRSMVAAMAMSPFAAMSLPLVKDEKWQESAKEFGDKLREKIRSVVDRESFQAWVAEVDQNVMYMDKTYPWMGVDLSYVWDPELWARFKEAIFWENPNIFWNKLVDKINYKAIIPQAGIVGDMRISYAKFRQLLETDRIKRVVVYGDMKTAIVEVPHPWYASISGAPGVYPFLEDSLGRPINLMIPNPEAPDDPTQWYCPEMPEWNMEKYRFYVDLPGDFWDQGVMLKYLRARDVRVMWDQESKEYVVPLNSFSKLNKVKTELQLMDPADSWDFLSWMTDPKKLDFYEKAAAVCVFGRGLTILLSWLAGTPIFKLWRMRKTKKSKKEESTWQRLTASRAREFMTKDKKTGKIRDTGVRFKDIAGLDHIVIEMQEVVKMLLNDPAYAKVGAKCPRGVIFQGPPGTGKTYLARAIAGEAGVTFFSAVGSEFVEMFAGVAAARVNNLFSTARKRSPAIIFIDEIDAIGRARSAGGGDPGSIERESALLAMLVQMDGIHGKLEQVLTIGATNLAAELDQALLRPGRFEVVYEIPSPGPVARMEILRYHAKNKALATDDLLPKVAEVTSGWSAAALANLLNEAAILTVRRNIPAITQSLLLELVEGLNWGDKQPKIPMTEGKHRLAIVTASKAVAFALTPGLEPIKDVSLWPKRQGLGPSVNFLNAVDNVDPEWHAEMIDLMDFKTNMKVNAANIGDERLGEFFHVASLLLPLYAPRATELAFFGPEGVSLATASPISDCFELAYYCVRNSMLHPRFRSLPPLHTLIWLGENPRGLDQRDPLAEGLDEELGYHKLTLTLLKAAWKRASKMVAERRTAIVKVAEELLEAEDETMSGERLVEIIETTPLDDASDIVIESDFLPILKEVLGRVPEVMTKAVATTEAELLAEASAASPPPPASTSSTADKTASRSSIESSSSSDVSSTVSFRSTGVGRVGQTSFSQRAAASTSAAAAAGTAALQQPSAVSFRTSAGDMGAVGLASFTRAAAPAASSTASSTSEGTAPPSSTAPSVPAEESPSSPPAGSSATEAAAASDSATGESPAEASARLLKLDDETLATVSRAIMGRLDIVDLVGKKTAYEVAEKVREALLDPETVERLKAVRRFVEKEDAEFPPAPLEKDISGPLYGVASGNLNFWMRRRASSLSSSALEMLYTERELAAYREDQDKPGFEVPQEKAAAGAAAGKR